MYGCKNSFEIKIRLKQKYLSNTFYICNLWLQVLFYELAYPLRNGSPNLLSWNKETLHSEMNCSLQLITVTYKEKMFFWNNYSILDHRLFLWVLSYYFTKIFVHLSVIVAVRYFSVYKLIRWDSANIYLFKVNSRALEKWVNYVQS